MLPLSVVPLASEDPCLESNVFRDPHINFAFGGSADLRGRHNTLYNFLSAPGLSVNVKTEEAVFKMHGGALTINGTFLTEAHITAQLSPQKLATASFIAAELSSNNFGWQVVSGTCVGRPFKFGAHGKKDCFGLKMAMDYSSATFAFRNWTMKVHGMHTCKGCLVSGAEHRLDIGFSARGDAPSRDRPHGLIGQSYTRQEPLNGKKDLYPWAGFYTTSAQAEGAIEGTASDYETQSAHATKFRFSRFDAIRGEPTSKDSAKAADTVDASSTERLADPNTEEERRRLSEVCPPSAAGASMDLAPPTPAPPSPPPHPCKTFACPEGYLARTTYPEGSGAATLDRATCCYKGGVCAGQEVGGACSLGDLQASLVPNPSFEDRLKCPDQMAQLDPRWAVGWNQATSGTTDYLVGKDACPNNYGAGVAGTTGTIMRAYEKLRTSIEPSDGDAFVGTNKWVVGNKDGAVCLPEMELYDVCEMKKAQPDNPAPMGPYYEYIGTCLKSPLKSGASYTLTMDVAVPGDPDISPGDTNGDSEVLCVESCSSLPLIGSHDHMGDQFPVLASASPGGGLQMKGGWKALTFSFTPNLDCAAVMFGPAKTQSENSWGGDGSYVFYDAVNLQGGPAGVCNAKGECVPTNK